MESTINGDDDHGQKEKLYCEHKYSSGIEEVLFIIIFSLSHPLRCPQFPDRMEYLIVVLLICMDIFAPARIDASRFVAL